MIASFGDRATEDLYHGRKSKAVRRLPPGILSVAFRKLDMVNAAQALQDLSSPPGNRLEALTGDLKGYNSIRINDQWRLVFRWSDGKAYEVRIADYHS
ncbi:MAG TPA: type II toxin-antitoxin system RelE/ParE family toxin [Verrucomicrobiae bacterium]|nr:type II toxin-antitoxin system RelE/ParE family toxin [Verrucomicrobiae bacterium]